MGNMSTSPVLDVDRLNRAHGDVRVAEDLPFYVARGELFAATPSPRSSTRRMTFVIGVW